MSLLFLEPVFKQMIWGGSRLAKDYGYTIPGDDTGECWGISAHKKGVCTVKNGPFAGEKLTDLWENHPELFGDIGGDRFPLLVKIIDANTDLSIQVHPDDAYAKAHESGDTGKTECWYILDCVKDATLIVGHNATTREELCAMIEEGKWSQLLREIPIKKGDFIQINPGMVHAIKGGMLILETQQNSDLTYRVYDYDRITNGQKRELHLQESMEVITVPSENLADSLFSTLDMEVNKMNVLQKCDKYVVFKLCVSGETTVQQEYPFLLMSVVEGEGTLNGQNIKKGDHFIVPCGYGEMKLKGNMEIIASTVKEV